MKVNPFHMDSRLKDMIIAKSKEFAGRKVDSSKTDDLWAAYQELLAKMPDRKDELYDAWLDVSAENNPGPIRLPLEEFHGIYFRDEDSKWYGIVDDQIEELPYQDFEDIWWDDERNSYVGIKEGISANPGTDGIIFDAGKNNWFDIMTGEVI